MNRLWTGLLAALIATPVYAPSLIAADLHEWRHGIIEPKSDAGFALMPLQPRFAAPQGLDVTVVNIQSDQVGLKALISGDLDSYEGAPNSAIVAASRGADVKIIACAWPQLVQGIFVHKDITALEDLRGKNVAISAPGSMPDMVIHAVLKANNVPASEIRFASLGSDADRFKALSAGIVQAAVVSTEFQTVASPDVKLFKPLREVMPNFLRGCIMVSGSGLAKRKADAAHLVAAEIEGLRVATTDRAAEVALTKEATHAKPDDPRAAFIWDEATKKGDIDASMPLPVEKILWMQDLLADNGLVVKKQPIDVLVDASVQPMALEFVKQK
jgi:ABC-type nitrate/sulfonate/bicarbonate transport system substrate-binding protein